MVLCRVSRAIPSSVVVGIQNAGLVRSITTSSSSLTSSSSILFVGNQTQPRVSVEPTLTVAGTQLAPFSTTSSSSGTKSDAAAAATNNNNNEDSTATSTKKDASQSPRGATTKKNKARASVYVHPLSQIVLMYLQTECHDWIVHQNLQSSLRIQRDGTFLLEYPDGVSRIWTYYDPMDKKHWLSYASGQIQHRFLLQDNLLPAWNGNNKRLSLPERIHESVKDMIHAIEEIE